MELFFYFRSNSIIYWAFKIKYYLKYALGHGVNTRFEFFLRSEIPPLLWCFLNPERYYIAFYLRIRDVKNFPHVFRGLKSRLRTDHTGICMFLSSKDSFNILEMQIVVSSCWKINSSSDNSSARSIIKFAIHFRFHWIQASLTGRWRYGEWPLQGALLSSSDPLVGRS